MSRWSTLVLLALCALLVLGARLLPERQGWAEFGGTYAARNEAWTETALAMPSDDPTAVFAQANKAAQAVDEGQIAEAIAAQRASERYPDEQGGWRVPRNGDSYIWLRNAQNVLAHGTACDVVVEGDCRDTLAPAPTGHTMRYADILHVKVLAAALAVGEWVHPALPAEVSAGTVVHLIALLGVLPAFFVGRRIGGHWIGGVVAALTAALHPMVLGRSLSLDNDIWNVTLPLWIAWTFANGLTAGSRRLWWIAATLGAVGLQAMMWDGWVFIAILVGLTALAHPFIAWSAGARTGAWATWAVAATVLPGLAALLWLTGDIDQFGRGAGLGSGALWDGFPWALNVVAELAKLPPESILATPHGAVPLQLAVLGVVVLVRFHRLWEGNFWITFLVAAVCQTAAQALGLIDPGANRWWFVILLALPMLVAGAIQLIERTDRDSGREGFALFMGLWLIAALYLSLDAARFQLLMAAPMGFGLAVLCGRLCVGLSRANDGAAPTVWRRTGAIALCLLPLVPVGYGALLVADDLAPSRLSRALISSLQSMKSDTPAQTILVTPWSTGYVTKYFAQRPVFADGGLLLTHMPTWVDRVMASDDPVFAYNTLRMLACLGDATPLPEGRNSLHGRLVALGLSPLKASIASLDMLRGAPSGFPAALARHGVAPAEAQQLAEAVRCRPPPTYIIVTDRQYLGGEPFALGLDDPLRMAAVQVAQGRTLADDVEIPTQEIDTAKRALAAGARQVYEAGLTGLFNPRSLTCRPDAQRVRCVDQGGSNHVLMIGTPGSDTDPVRVWVQTGAGIVEPRLGDVHVVDDRQVRSIEMDPALGGLDVAWHPGGTRAVVGSDPMPLSLIARLSMLDGGAVPWAERVSRVSDARQEVSIWQVRW